MSGGHWDYSGYPIQTRIEAIANDPQVRKRWPRTAAVLKALAPVLYEIEHDMDWDLSSDTLIINDSEFDDGAWEKIWCAAHAQSVIIDPTKCEKCQACTARGIHPCPYRMDVGNGDTTPCNCCESCAQQCADDI